MHRKQALILVFFLALLFFIIAYYGAGITLTSSIVFSMFISLILLLFLYPSRRLVSDTPDVSLVVYVVYLVVVLTAISFYVIYKTITDQRVEMSPPAVKLAPRRKTPNTARCA